MCQVKDVHERSVLALHEMQLFAVHLVTVELGQVQKHFGALRATRDLEALGMPEPAIVFDRSIG